MKKLSSFKTSKNFFKKEYTESNNFHYQMSPITIFVSTTKQQDLNNEIKKVLTSSHKYLMIYENAKMRLAKNLIESFILKLALRNLFPKICEAITCQVEP